MLRAFNAAKDKKKSENDYDDDYINWVEFRYLLLSLRMYAEYWCAFARIDTDDDRRISKEEFVAGKHQLERWVGPIMDVEALFE